jgi:hypothetical protein
MNNEHSLDDKEVKRLIKALRTSHISDFPHNLLNKTDTRLFIDNFHQLSMIEESSDHNGGELPLFCALLKLASEHHNLQFNMPEIGKKDLKILKISNLSEPWQTFAWIDHRAPPIKWVVGGALAAMFLLSNKAESIEIEPSLNDKAPMAHVAMPRAEL